MSMSTKTSELNWTISFEDESLNSESVWEEIHRTKKSDSNCTILLWEINDSNFLKFGQRRFQVFLGIEDETETIYTKNKTLLDFAHMPTIIDWKARWGIFFGFHTLHEAVEFIVECKEYYDKNYN